MEHKPVLLKEVLYWMSWQQEGLQIADLTVGGGGHLKALLKECPSPASLEAWDQDPYALEKAKENLNAFSFIEFVNENFREFGKTKLKKFDRILIDLGVSSFQLDQAERGFSFQKDAILDMRMQPRSGEPAWKWLSNCSEEELADVLHHYGEERKARFVARKWIEARKKKEIKTVKDFLAVFGWKLESRNRFGRHPAMRIFQAIRIHINQELQVLDEILDRLPDLLNIHGRVLILSFHSLEDRAVKWGLRGRLKSLHKKVIQASEAEKKENPRARSAKLRVYEREYEDSKSLR